MSSAFEVFSLFFGGGGGRELKLFRRRDKMIIDFLLVIEYACEATRIKISTTSLSTRFFEKKQLERATEFLYHVRT